MDWSIRIDAEGPPSEAVDPSALDELVDILTPHSTSVTGGGSRYSVRFDVQGYANAPDGIQRAVDIFHVAAEKAGLPAWPIVSVEAQTFEEQERELERPLLPELVGVAEAAEILRVSRQRISQLVQASHPKFPKPLFSLAATPVWTRSQIERFDELWDRKVGRPSTERSI